MTVETDNLMSSFASDDRRDEGGIDLGDDEDDSLEFVQLNDDLNYLGPFLRTLAIVHTLLSFSIMVAYYVLKVTLIVEKKKDMCDL